MILAHPAFSLFPRPLLVTPTSTAQPQEDTPLPRFAHPTYRRRLSLSCPDRREDEGL